MPATTERAITPADARRDLLKRAKAGDRSALPAVRELLRDPAEVEALGGSMARWVEEAFVEALTRDGDLLTREAVCRKLELLRLELCGPDPTPLERLLVERAVTCWLQVQDADSRLAHAQRPDVKATVPWLEFCQRRCDRANRRLLAAARTLAVVRKLALPTLLVMPTRPAAPRPVIEERRP